MVPLRRLGMTWALWAVFCVALRANAAPPDRIRFSHQVHQRAQVDCLTCHEAAAEATTLEAQFLPKEAVCLRCHKEQKASGNCAFCHANVERPVRWAPKKSELIFSHAGHIDLVNEECTRCHVKLSEPGNPGPHPPAMSTCATCHEHKAQIDQGRCQVCHTDLRRSPLWPVTVFSHQPDFLRRHPVLARSGASECARCHVQTFCSDCHAARTSLPIRPELRAPERVDRETMHPGDFLSRHGIESRATEASCRRCHENRFCERCHQTYGLSPASANPRNPHPEDWLFPGTGHGVAARRDITGCASCHDQGAQSNCVSCHRVGGLGGNPHPVGWSSRHPASEIERSSMCLVCHL